MIAPLPPHWEHGCEIEKSPWPCDSTPRPWQRGQTFGVVPGFAPLPRHVAHSCDIGTCSETCAPSTACSKLSDTSVSRSRPFSARGPRGWVRVPPAAPPKRLERMSLNDDPVSNPPPLVANALGPPRSYFLRFSGSPRMS
jgi:hypothetical protein